MTQIPGWNPNAQQTAEPSFHVTLSIMDGVRFGLGLAVAWLVLIPVAVFLTVTMLNRM